jgi:hypothetical protein
VCVCACVVTRIICELTRLIGCLFQAEEGRNRNLFIYDNALFPVSFLNPTLSVYFLFLGLIMFPKLLTQIKFDRINNFN